MFLSAVRTECLISGQMKPNFNNSVASWVLYVTPLILRGLLWALRATGLRDQYNLGG